MVAPPPPPALLLWGVFVWWPLLTCPPPLVPFQKPILRIVKIRGSNQIINLGSKPMVAVVFNSQHMWFCSIVSN